MHRPKEIPLARRALCGNRGFQPFENVNPPDSDVRSNVLLDHLWIVMFPSRSRSFVRTHKVQDRFKSLVREVQCLCIWLREMWICLVRVDAHLQDNPQE